MLELAYEIISTDSSRGERQRFKLKEEKERLRHDVYGCYYDTSGLEEQLETVSTATEQIQQQYWMCVSNHSGGITYKSDIPLVSQNELEK